MTHLFNSGRANFPGLDEEEALKFQLLQIHLFASFELWLDYRRIGAVKTETIEAAERFVREQFAYRGIRDWWEQQGRKTLADDVTDWVDRLVGEFAGAASGGEV